MKLYFVRHGTAASKATWDSNDDLRPLTRAGRERFSTAAESLKRAAVLDPELIVTSPLVRAEQTAELLGKALGGSMRIERDPRLGHQFDLAALAAILAEHPDIGSLAVVGHNPSFAAVLSAVIGGGDVDMRKGAIALVDIDDVSRPVGRLMWVAPPALFARDS